MRIVPQSVGTLHFIGIGGIGMSGIAEVLHALGYSVQGSDIADGYNTERLRKAGMNIFIGHKAENVKDAAIVVVSSAIKTDNPELVAARAAKLPVVRRAEMLAELMRLKMAVAIAGTRRTGGRDPVINISSIEIGANAGGVLFVLASVLTVALGVLALVILLRFKINSTWLVFGGALIGFLAFSLR